MPKVIGTNLLTVAKINAWLKRPKGLYLHDGGGLYLRLRTGGAYWALRQVNPLTGERTWAALLADVPYPDATLEAARTAATRARPLTAQHTDLVRENKARLHAKRAEVSAAELALQRRVTVRQLFDRWASVDLRPHTRADGRRAGRKDGGEYTRQQFERHVFPKLGHLPITDVRKADVLTILDAHKAAGRLRTANVLLTDLKQMFGFALAREIIDRNPLDTISKRQAGGKDVERERTLSADEIKLLAKAIPGAGLGPRTEQALWVILSTGCRIGELMNAEWSQVNLFDKRWHIPSEHSKNQREHVIHLSDFAVKRFEALSDLRERTSPGLPIPWVFPNRMGSGPVDVRTFGKQLNDRQRVADKRLPHRSKRTRALALPGGHWTAHDLRRTAATLMASIGISSDVIDECLNHMIQSRVTRIYVRDRREVEQARAFDALGALLVHTIKDEKVPSNIVELRAA